MMPRPDDREAAMARADLYKLANYSMKLFKMIQDGDQLEGWVQAKITKSADYIASVYHYMEYEMKFSEYGEKLETADIYSESVRQQFKEKLMEAKTKLDKLKKRNEKDLGEDLKKVGDTKKTRTGVVTKTATGVVHKNTDYKDDGDADDKSGKGKKSHAKTQTAAEKKAQAPKQKQSPKSAKTWGMKDSEKFDNRDKVKESMSPEDGATAPPPKGKDGQYPLITSGPHKGKRWTAKAPGPTNPAFGAAKTKSHPVMPSRQIPVKEVKSEKFDALKHVKNPTKGEKTAAKDVKRGSYADRAAMLKSAEKDGRLKEASKPDFLDMDKDGNKKEPMKKAVADKKAGPKKGVNPFAKK